MSTTGVWKIIFLGEFNENLNLRSVSGTKEGAKRPVLEPDPAALRL